VALSEGLITFLYYEDVGKAAEFYRETMGFEQVMDREWVKIFKVSGGAHVGLVNAERGWHKPSEEKPVMLSVMVPDADEWHRRLTSMGARTDLEAPKDSGEIKMRAFRTWDPEGYVIEIVEFKTPYGL
jgi:lactoylglutathione lyase